MAPIYSWGHDLSFFAQDVKRDSTADNLFLEDNEGKNPMSASLKSLISAVQILSPQAASLARYGEYPVSLATGVPHIFIPLYSIEVGDFVLPINISYHAAGNKVNDVASPVGLGWTLNAGGAISRTIKNRIDCLGQDLYNNVPFYTKEIVDSMKLVERYRPDSEAANVDFWNGLLDLSSQFYDTESDRYSYNFCGYSGVFRYSFAEECFRTIPHEPIKIEMNDTIGLFTIIDTKGNRYFFGQEEKSGIWDVNFDIPVSTYYLTKIYLANINDSIIFEYADDALNTYGNMIPSEFYHKGLAYSEENEQGTLELHQEMYRSDFFCQEQILKKIIWHDGFIELDYLFDREDPASARLRSMTVKDNAGNTIKQILFKNSIHRKSFGRVESARLFLDELILSGSNNSEKETYNFEYDAMSLPPYVTAESYTIYTDYWGYYNGNAQEYYSIPNEYASLIGVRGRDMTPVEQYMKAGILKRIVYPTGGFTCFEFEFNKVPIKGSETILGGLRIKEICNYIDEGDRISLVERKCYEYSGYACSPIDKYKYYYEEPYFWRM